MGVMTSVVLRPVTHQDLDLFEAEFATPAGAGAYQWFGHHSPLDLRRRFAETRLLTPDGGTLTICAEAGEVAGRVEWFKRALEKAGFEREGVLRQAQWRAGHWHDQVLYSTLRPHRVTAQGDERHGDASST